MKRSVLIFLFICYSILTFSQELDGKYNDCYDDYLFFNKGQVEFSIQSNNGLIFPLKGIGEFYISKGYLFIRTSKFNIRQKKYYVKDKIQEIVENKLLIFKIMELEKEKISLKLLTIDPIANIYTDEVPQKLENNSKGFQIREFKKQTITAANL